MKITKTQLKQIIIESLEDYEAMYDRGASPEEIVRSYTDKEAEERAEYIEVYKMVLGMMDKLEIDKATKERVDDALLDLLGKAGIAL